MMGIDRRRFLASSVATMISGTCGLGYRESAKTQLQPIVPYPARTRAVVPDTFVGLGYETLILSDESFFHEANTGLMDLFRKLSTKGILRLGGNSSDCGWWKATTESGKPSLSSNYLATVGSSAFAKGLYFAVTPASIVNLRGFLDAVGWTCIYGLNLACGTPARAAEEASFVAKTLGSKLMFFQIGNEPDGYLYKELYRSSTWSVDRFFDEWLAIANAVRARVPHARFALPDIAGTPDWFAPIVARLQSLPAAGRPDVVGVTHHYYQLDPKRPNNDMSRLLRKPDAWFDRNVAACRTAAAKLGVPYYITETNSCEDGGLYGISDVFASALWAVDYTLEVMSLGYSGINFQTGPGMNAASGQSISLKNPDSYHPSCRYTPISSSSLDNRQHVAQPLFYGIQFASIFAGATFIDVDFSPGTVNASAYAAKLADGHIAIAVINKDATQSLKCDLSAFSSALFLQGPAFTSRGGIEIVGPKPIRDMSSIPPRCAVILRLGE